VSGEVLTVNGDECLYANGQPVLKFSLQFLKQMESMKERNYELKNVKVNFIVYWLKEETKQEFKIVLPELYFGKK
jgi:ATP-dependent DNA helicase RecQ